MKFFAVLWPPLRKHEFNAYTYGYFPRTAGLARVYYAVFAVCDREITTPNSFILLFSWVSSPFFTAALQTPLAWLTVKAGMVMTNAGIDESNADGKLLLLPQDCYACAEELRTALRAHYGVKELGVVITDSMILPLRAGVIAGAVGYAGFQGVKDLRGKADIFGKKLAVTLVDAADTLASAAALCMGEADETCPLCMIERAPVVFTAHTRPQEMHYPAKDDLYAPLFQAVGLLKD